jgi:hypothetical protein
MINSILYVSAFLAAFKGVQAGINLNSAQNIAVYWGNYPTRQNDDALSLIFCFSRPKFHKLG